MAALPHSCWDPLRGQGPWFAVAFINRCDETDKGVKNFQLDKVQLLESSEASNAIAAFQHLRRLTMKVNPRSSSARKRNFGFTEEASKILRHSKTLRAIPTDVSLSECYTGALTIMLLSLLPI
jgi:hypothetical protein